MFHSKVAVCGTWAPGKLGLRLFCHIVTFNLFLVAMLTEVGGSPAEELGNRAAELALKFYIFGAMFCAVDNTSTHT